jgi:mono/diheme cytochrome c family protein
MDKIREYNIDPNEEVVGSRKEKLNLTGIYALIYFMILVAIISIGTMYLSKLGYMTANKIVPFTLSDTAQVTTMGELPVKKGSIAPPVDVFAYEKPDANTIETGKQLYASNCSSCHGETGDGKGPAGASLNPPPRNFTSMENWKNGPTIEGMYKTLIEGIPNTGMAAFSNLPAKQRLDIISYLRTFSPNFPAVTTADLQKLDDTYGLSKGEKQPNQIPISMAIDKLLLEYKPKEVQIKNAVGIAEKDNSAGAQLLKRASSDIEKSITALVNDKSWTVSEGIFVTFISTNPLQKGFKARIDDFTSEEWSTLFGYLRNIISNEQAEENNNANNEQKTENQSQPK